MTRTLKLGITSTIALAALLAAGLQLWPDEHASSTMNIGGDYAWVCTDCGHEFDAETEQPHGDGLSLLGGSFAARVQCPACQKMTGRLAERCAKCSTLFFPEYKTLIPTEQDRCPDCGWSRLDDVLAEMRAHGIEPPTNAGPDGGHAGR